MTPDSKPAQPTDAQIAVGGEPVSVINRADGALRSIFVAQLRRSQIEGYLAAEAQGELALLSYITGRPVEELDNLTLDSVEALVAADRRQNFSCARAVEQRRTEAGLRALEGLRAEMPERYAQILADLEKASPSPASSHVSFSTAPSPGAKPTS